ncbi:MAG: SURF1 family protein [Pseudomonadota bacterium]
MRSSVLVTVAAFGALLILVGLGTWQLQRLQWKEGLIARVEAGLRKPASPLREVAAASRSGDDVAYRPVITRGRYEHDRAVRVYAVENGTAGWNVYTPLVLAEGGARVFVNRGFVPEAFGATAPTLSEPDGLQQVVGVVRRPPSRTSVFTPENEPEAGRFYWRDLTNMVAARYDKTEANFLPLFVQAVPASAVVGQAADALASPPPGGEGIWPRPASPRPDISNRHLEYAITWYSLALALVGVYAFFMFGRRRKT